MTAAVVFTGCIRANMNYLNAKMIGQIAVLINIRYFATEQFLPF